MATRCGSIRRGCVTTCSVPDPWRPWRSPRSTAPWPGMALWFRTFSTFLGEPGIWLEDLYVVRRTAAAASARALLHHLRGLTAGRVEWSVLDWNRKAIEFYERLGARPDEGGWIMYRWAPS